MILRMIREGIIEMMEEHFQAFQFWMFVEQYEAHTLTFKDLWGCGAPDFFVVKDHIASRRW